MSAQQIRIKVTANARQETVKKLDGDLDYHVYVRAVPEKGKANEAVIKLMSEYLNHPKSNIKITKGAQNSRKTLLIKEG